MLVVRDSGGEVHAFLNVCRHRGNRLCRAEEATQHFTCAYHGWTYRNDGRLIGVPYLKEAYHDELDRGRGGSCRLRSSTITRDCGSPPSMPRRRRCATTR